MKLLSLNTHSLEETNMAEKQQIFADTILRLQPDVIALQEVNQTISKPALPAVPENLMVLDSRISLKEDNHAYAVWSLIKKGGLDYYCAWLPMKVGYDKYDEGMAILTRKPILNAEAILLSHNADYSDYRTRYALAVTTEDGTFVCVHMGWWSLEEESFQNQWKRLMDQLPVSIQPQKKTSEHRLFLMGDFNAQADMRYEGYDMVIKSGFYDLYEQAEDKDDGFTVVKVIDGWRDSEDPACKRIDFIFAAQPENVVSMHTIFNGREEPVISDHLGLYAIIK